MPALAAGVLPGAVEHEMTHNFDVFNAYLFSGAPGPGAHAWTAFVQLYMNLYARTGSVTESPEATMESWLEQTLAPYLSDPTATWANCVSTGNCPAGVVPDLAWAGISNHFAVLHGPSVMQSFFSSLRNYTDVNPPPSDLQGKADLHIASMAAAVNEDLRCYVSHWRWSISSQLDAQLALNPAAPFCADTDLDSWSTLEGACDDGVPLAHPGASETLNGLDDDCSGVVDDLAYLEPIGGDFASNLLLNFPNTITGEITTSDNDDFTFDLLAPMNVEIEMCSDGFQGWLFVLNQDNSWFDYQYVFDGQCHSKVYALDEVRIWRFDVALNAASHPGAYRVSVRPAEDWPLASSWGVPNAVVEPEFPVTLGTNSVAVAPAFPPTDVRFWVAGLGFVSTVPCSSGGTTPFDPGPDGAGIYSYRVQLLSSGVPATDWSSTETFVPEPGFGSILIAGMGALAGLASRRSRSRGGSKLERQRRGRPRYPASAC